MPKFSVKKPLTVFVAVLAILVLGVVAYLKMTPDLLPNMNFPYAVIVTADPGASSETVETKVTKPMEQAMATLTDIKSVTSTSKNSVSVVMLEFEEKVNMDAIGVDIQQKIAALQGAWDDTVGTPTVLKINPSMLPVEVAAVSYDGMDVAQLSAFVSDTLTQKLEGISGVASVAVSGTLQQQMNVVLSQEKMDEVSEKLAQKVNEQLSAAASTLKSTQAQIESAKGAIQSTKEGVVSDVVTQALSAVRDSMEEMNSQQSTIQSRLEDLTQLLEKAPALLAQKNAYETRIRSIEENPLLTEEQKQTQIATIKAEEDYIHLQAELARAEVLMASVQTDWENLQSAVESYQKQLDQINEQIRKFKTDNAYVAEIAQGIIDGALTLTDGVQQIIAADIQLDSALAQIQQGFATLESTKESALQQTDLSAVMNLSTISALLSAQNFAMPAGYVEQDGVNYMVSVGDSIGNQKELEDLVLFDLGLDGVEPIRLRDVAEVFLTGNGDEIYAKLNGENGIIVTFNKQSTYATAEVSDNVAARFEKLEETYPGLHFTALMDQGDYIHIIINAILSSLAWGAVFAILILYLFLKDLRPTVITLVSIPVSVIFAVVLMYFSGVTINMISLSGLAVAVGMLVDNSVVVIENIYRLRAKGANARQAAVVGAGQVLGAIVASTLTTVCVFLPIVFVEGITKQLFTDLALTMCYSLLASLIVALTLVPAMASGMLRKEKPVKAGLLDKFYPIYRKSVTWSLQHKAVVLSAAVLLLIGSAALAMSRGFAFMPDIDMNTVNVTITMPEGCDRETAIALADEVSARALTIENVETVGSMMSSGGGMMTMSSDGSGGSYDVTTYLLLPEGKSGKEAGQKLVELCEDLDCTVSYSGAADMMTTSMVGNGVSLKVYGEDMEDLQQAAKDLAAKIETVEGILTVSDGLEDAAPAIHLAVDRLKAMEHGMTVAQIYMQVASHLSTSTNGGNLNLDGEDMDVIVALPDEQVIDVDHLLEMEITPTSASSGMGSSMGSSMGGGMSAAASSGMTGTTAGSAPFKLGDVATTEKTVSMDTISRSEQRRCVTVTAEVSEGYNITKVSEAVTAAVADTVLPDGITADFDGENEMIMDAMQQLALMLLLGVLLVYLVMVAQFQSLKSPFIVMFTIPLAFTGGFLMLLVCGVEVSVVSMIGFVMLVGIIVNNGIVLVDYINNLRLEGMERQEAIVEAGVTRLRPILMTSLTTILGLLVMAFGGDAGTALMQPVALVCIGGLLYATLMTLLVVPCMYDIISRRQLRKVEEDDLRFIEE